MLIIKNFLSTESCDQIVSTLNQIGWLGAKNENPEYNELIKRHLQLNGEDHPQIKKYGTTLSQAIIDSEQVIRFTQPNFINGLQFNCYQEGSSYERHSDNSYIGIGAPRIRTDYTIGLLLTDSYEGGDLILEHHGGVVQNPKMTKGDLIIYNCGIMHWVTPVTKGERIIGIGWIESKFKNQEEREIASSVLKLYESLKEEKGLDNTQTQEANSIYHNLCRRWQTR